MDRGPFYKKEEVMLKQNEKLFLDTYSKRFFRATMDDVLLAEKEVNYELELTGYADLGSFYSSLGIKFTEDESIICWIFDAAIQHYGIRTINFKNEHVKHGDWECYKICYPFDCDTEFLEFA